MDDLQSLILGILCAIATYLLYVRNKMWLASKPDHSKTLLKMKSFQAWMGIVTFAIISVAYIIKAFYS